MDRLDHLGYYWIAKFSDDSEIKQFNEDESENLFKDVEDKKEDLVSFSLISKDGKEVYTVNLVEQTLVGPTTEGNISGDNPKLIYFRRNNVRGEVGTGRVLEAKLTHVLGIKTDQDEKMFEISPQLHMRKKKISIVHPISSIRQVESRINITKDVEGEIKNELESDLQ